MQTTFVSEFLATGGAVTIRIYDPVTELEVSTSNDTCDENGSTGLYKWDLSKITTTPSSYKEYAYKMTDGSEERAGIAKYDNFFDQYIVTETAEV